MYTECLPDQYGYVPGASVRNSARGKCHEEGGFSIYKGGIKPQETPCSWASTPKTRVCLLYSCSHLYLWLYGGLSPFTISLWGGVNLQFQLIKIPGHDKSVSTYELLWRLSSLPVQVQPHVIVYSFPNFMTLCRRQGLRPSPGKRNAKKQNGCLGRLYK